MRNIRALAMIVLSLVAGIAALQLATRWLNAQTFVATNPVVVAAVDLSAGQQISEQQLRIIEWPAGSVPAGVFTTVAALKERVTRTSISRDEPVVESRLAAPGTRGGMAAIIKEGKRAITVKVNDVVGVAGFALPGTFVDVMVNVRNNNENQSISKIVLERILVLAVAQETGRDDNKPKVVNAVTLEVTPPEAEKIDLARAVGSLSLVLRNNVDDDAIKTVGATEDLLLGRVAKQAAPAKVVVKRTEVNNPQPKRVCVDSWDGVSYKAECF